jgi:hypothetical protein
MFRSDDADPPAGPGHIEIERVEGMDDTVPFDVPQKGSISLPPTKTIDVFMFHVHEEGPSLDHFCKHPIVGKYDTICVRVSHPYYYLQFLPLPNHETRSPTK